MIDRELSELRRRMGPDKNCISKVFGCYVNERKEIVSTFSQHVGKMGDIERQTYTGFFKKALGGHIGTEQREIEAQFGEPDEMKAALLALRDSEMKQPELAEAFCEHLVEFIEYDKPYLILLATDTYDVPCRDEDGRLTDDESTEVYSYLLCTVCSVKEAKPALKYTTEDKKFRGRPGGWVVTRPELGFIYPSFDGRTANYDGALLYSRDTSLSHHPLLQFLFHTEPGIPAAHQRETFEAAFTATVVQECGCKQALAIQQAIATRVDTALTDGREETLNITSGDLKDIMKDAGVPEAQVEDFATMMSHNVGEDTPINLMNLVDPKTPMHIKTEVATVKVGNKFKGEGIDTTVINGRTYLLVPMDGEVEINGVPVSFEP